MKEFTCEIVNEIFEYSYDTGELTHKNRRKQFFSREQDWKRWNNKYAGKRAGSVKRTKKGDYRVVGIFGKQYMEHHVIWILVKGYASSRLGHRNRDACDNRWDNLYEAEYAESNRNQSRRKDNLSGVSGVFWDSKANKWRAQVRFEGHRHEVGSFESLADAEIEVDIFREKHGFSKLHGKPKETVQ